jgi:hypothetical protein
LLIAGGMKQLAAIAVLSSLTALSTTAHASHAAPGFVVQGMLGFNAEGEIDEISCQSGCTGSLNGRDEDLEGNYGASVAYERSMGEQLRVGARAAVMTGETDDSNIDMMAYDLGAWGRYQVPVSPKATVYAAAAVGPSYLSAEVPYGGIDWGFGGIGFHATAGGGVEVATGQTFTFVAGAYFSYHQGSLEAEEQGVTVEAEGVTARRFVITAGVAF